MNLKPIFMVCLFLIGNSLFAQDSEILDVHKKGSHSIGAFYFPMVAWNSYTSTTHQGNLRYSYAFKDRWEIGLNLGAQYYHVDKIWNSETKRIGYLYGSITPFVRYYLGKEKFGAFVEGGIRSSFNFTRGFEYELNEFGTYEITDNRKDYFSMNEHTLYGSIGLYYHGLAKGRLGLESAIGIGPAYYYNHYGFPGTNFGLGLDLQFRLKYFFGNRKRK